MYSVIISTIKVYNGRTWKGAITCFSNLTLFCKRRRGKRKKLLGLKPSGWCKSESSAELWPWCSVKQLMLPIPGGECFCWHVSYVLNYTHTRSESGMSSVFCCAAARLYHHTRLTLKSDQGCRDRKWLWERRGRNLCVCVRTRKITDTVLCVCVSEWVCISVWKKKRSEACRVKSF